MATVVQGEHDTIITLKTTGEELRRFKGRRTLGSALEEFARGRRIKEYKIDSGPWGTILTNRKDGVRYRATYARPKKGSGK